MWLLNILVPGAALMWSGKHVRGAIVAAGYLFMVALAVGAAAAGHSWWAVAAASVAGGVFAQGQLLWLAHARLHRSSTWRLHVAALRETTEAHVSHERYTEAIEVIEGWLYEDPRSVDPWLLLGDIHLDCGHRDRAQRAYLRARTLDRGGRYAERIDQALARARR